MSAVPLHPATDLEEGKSGQGVVSQPSEVGFPKEYYVVYGFSLFIVSVGVWALFFPFAKTSIVGNMCGVGGTVVGAFLVLNADLLVTYVRLMREMQRFKANNKQFSGSLKEQKKKIVQLKESKKALEGLEKHCHNKVGNLQQELMEIEHNARDNIRRNIVNVLTMTRPKGDIEDGEDLERVLRTFTNMYIRAFPLIVERFSEVRKGLKACDRWRRVKKMSVDRFKFIVVPSLFADISTIKELVRSKLERESDREAADVEDNDNPNNRPSSGVVNKMAAAGTDADWADAMDFAGDTKKDEAPPLPHDDSWADAISFAGRS